MVKLRTSIFGSLMYLYWGYPQGRNYVHVDNILKIMNFLKNFTFCNLWLTYIHTKDTYFIFGTAHTLYRYRQMDTDTVSFSHFALYVSILALYRLAYISSIFGSSINDKLPCVFVFCPLFVSSAGVHLFS